MKRLQPFSNRFKQKMGWYSTVWTPFMYVMHAQWPSIRGQESIHVNIIRSLRTKI